MARVFFPASLRSFTGELAELSIPAGNLRELIATLDSRFPGIGDAIRSGLAVAIDGASIQDGFLEELGPESEIHFVPPISGGSGRAGSAPAQAAARTGAPAGFPS